LYKKGKSVFVVKTVRVRWKYVTINAWKRRKKMYKMPLVKVKGKSLVFKMIIK